VRSKPIVTVLALVAVASAALSIAAQPIPVNLPAQRTGLDLEILYTYQFATVEGPGNGYTELSLTCGSIPCEVRVAYLSGRFAPECITLAPGEVWQRYPIYPDRRMYPSGYSSMYLSWEYRATVTAYHISQWYGKRRCINQSDDKCRLPLLQPENAVKE
jgi:hypothetical protein